MKEAAAAWMPISPLRLGRLLVVPISDLGDMAWAQWEILVSHRALRGKAAGDLVRVKDHGPGGSGVSPSERRALTRIAVAVGRVARHGLTRPTCLVRAIAMERMIARAGIDRAVVRIGVMQADGAFHAHAWIEVDGTVVGDSAAQVDKFVPLADFSGLSP